MNTSITCPRCQAEFEVTEVMRSQLMGQVRDELQSEAAVAKAEIDNARLRLDEEKAALVIARQDIEREIRARLEAQREQLRAESRHLAKEELAIELRDRDQQLLDLRQKLTADFVAALQADWDEHGKEIIEALRTKAPTKYAEIVSRLVTPEPMPADPYANIQSLQDIGRALLKQVGLSENQITDEMADRAAAANGVLAETLELERFPFRLTVS